MRRAWITVITVMLATLGVACGDADADLFVDLRTDLIPGVEVFGVRTERLRDSGERAEVTTLGAAFDDDFMQGVRVAELGGVPTGRVVLRVSLLDQVGDVVMAREVVVRHRRPGTSVTVLVSRDCRSHPCPGPGDPDGATACIGARCVAPECSEETPEACGAPDCRGDDDCASAAPCAVGLCVAGACFLDGDNSRCASGEFCDLETGCAPRPGVDRDAGRPDAGTPDAGPPDAGPPDAGTPDAGPPPLCPDADDDTLALFRFQLPTPPSRVLEDDVGRHDGMVSEPDEWRRRTGPPGCGAAIAFGTTGLYGVVPDSPEWDLDEGSIDFWFRFTAGAETHLGLLSRDAEGQALPGHVSVALSANRTLVARLQSTTDEVYLCSDAPMSPLRWHHVGLSFGAEPALWVDGALATGPETVRIEQPGFVDDVPCGGAFSGGISGNDNPWVIGASTTFAREGEGQPVTSPFVNGAIDHLRISSVTRDFSRFVAPDPSP